MNNREEFDGVNPNLTEEAYEDAAELFDDASLIIDHDLALDEQYNTQDGDGHSYNPHLAAAEGLTYTPPDDPPTMPGGRQNVEVAAGFGQSMERVNRTWDNDERMGDEDLADVVRDAIRMNSETQHLNHVRVRVRKGVVTLRGRVPDDMDLSNVDDIVREIDGVIDVNNQLDTEY